MTEGNIAIITTLEIAILVIFVSHATKLRQKENQNDVKTVNTKLLVSGLLFYEPDVAFTIAVKLRPHIAQTKLVCH